MGRREIWRMVLDQEKLRWAAKSASQLENELRELQVYEVEFDSKEYQIEIQLLENTRKYVHVVISVDDGSLPASLAPLTDTFIIEKSQHGYATD
jgi:hypothetical protein